MLILRRLNCHLFNKKAGHVQNVKYQIVTEKCCVVGQFHRVSSQNMKAFLTALLPKKVLLRIFMLRGGKREQVSPPREVRDQHSSTISERLVHSDSKRNVTVLQMSNIWGNEEHAGLLDKDRRDVDRVTPESLSTRLK